MAAHPSTLSAVNTPAQRLTTSPLCPASEDFDRYRLHVLAPSVGDVIVAAGGLICDRAMAGWDVTVSVARGVDDRPLRILGARAGNLSPAPASQRRASSPRVLAVATELLVDSEPVRRLVLAALGGTTANVLLWGGHCPHELERKFTRLAHRPTAAARAFKAHALTVVGTSSPMDTAEECFLSTI